MILAAPVYLIGGADDNPWLFLALPLFPLAVVDLCLSAACDTLFLPYDTWRYFQTTQADSLYQKQSQFWNHAFDTDTIDIEDARPNFADQIEHVILGALDAGRGKTNIIGGLLSLAVAEGRPNVLAALSRRAELSPDQCRSILAWAQNGKYSYGDATYIPHHLARNPATPVDMLIGFVVSSDALLCRAVADSGRLLWSELRDALANSPPEWLTHSMRSAADPTTPPGQLRGMAENMYFDGGSIQTAVAKNANTPVEGLRTLARSRFSEVRAALVDNPSTPRDVLLHLSTDSDALVRDAAARILNEGEHNEDR